MGSYGNAIMAGFICRLCSEQKKCVIHLYSVKAKKLALLKKIELIPIKVDKYDKLPKTICESCIEKLDMQYYLLQQIRKSSDIQRKHRLYHNNGSCPIDCPLHGIERELETEANGIGHTMEDEHRNETDVDSSNQIQTADVTIVEDEDEEYDILNRLQMEIHTIINIDSELTRELE